MMKRMGELRNGGRVYRFICLVVMVLVLVGCGGSTPPPPIATGTPIVIVVTATPEATVTDVPTATIAPTATNTPDEPDVPIELDCLTNTVDPVYAPINSNPCLYGEIVHVPHYTPDGRWHCTPRDFDAISVLYGQNTPAWVNCSDRDGRDVIRADLTSVNGRFGMSQFVGTFQTGVCYAIKQTGFIEGAGYVEHLNLVATLETDGESIPLYPQRFYAEDGYRTFDEKYTIFWYVISDRPRPSAVVQIYYDLIWATFNGHIEAWSFEVSVTPDHHCDSGVEVRW